MSIDYKNEDPSKTHSLSLSLSLFMLYSLANHINKTYMLLSLVHKI